MYLVDSLKERGSVIDLVNVVVVVLHVHLSICCLFRFCCCCCCCRQVISVNLSESCICFSTRLKLIHIVYLFCIWLSSLGVC